MAGRVIKPAAPRKKANGYKMPVAIPLGEVISDTILKKKWRIGPSIGVGGFGEIYSVCVHDSSPKKGTTYPYVIKIEPHENGPLFVEKNFYMRNANKEEITKFMKTRKLSSLGMPLHYGSGTYETKGEKLRYLVLERYGKNLWNIFEDCGRRFPPGTVFQVGLQMLDVLEYIHSRGYVHADIKGANILLGLKKGTENQTYLVDFGLATRISDKEFKPDPRCAHNGTIEYTSRDAHLGVPTVRGDLEILGYNLLQWLIGELPWEKCLKQPKTVQTMKENFLRSVRGSMSKYNNVPDALVKFFEYINSMKPKDTPDYAKCRQFFESYLKTQGKTRNSTLEFSPAKSPIKRGKAAKLRYENSTDDIDVSAEENEKPKRKRLTKKKVINDSTTEEDAKPKKGTKMGRKLKSINTNDENFDDCENEEPTELKKRKTTRNVKTVKRKSTEPVIVTKVKKVKLIPKCTPPAKKNHNNMATQTSVDKLIQNSRSVSFDSPISEIIGEKKSLRESESANSSGDIFEDSFTIKGKKVKKRLVSDEEVIVKKVVTKKVTTVKKGKSWKDCPAVVNGRSPPT